MNFPTLYHKSPSGGQIWQYVSWTEGPVLVKETGIVGGQMVQHRRTATAVNVGKSNETTPEQQAILEGQSDWNEKVRRKYVDDISKVNNYRVAVMLAPNDKWSDTINPKKSTKKYAKYPGHVQPKLDGARCLAYWDGDRIVLMTRGQKEWQAPHIKEQLAKILPKDAMFDGEMYFHGVKRQTIQKWLSNNYPESAKLEYHVYDVPLCDGEEKTWIERHADLERLVPGQPMKADPGTPHIVKVATLEVTTEEQVDAFQAWCIENGFEGSMFRNWDGRYEPDVRSKNLLKIKLFEDAEFKVIGFLQAEGGHSGCVIWICSTEQDHPIIGHVTEKPKSQKMFKVVPNGSLPDRQEWYQEALAGQHMGKQLTVKYQGFSEDGLPQIAKGIAFRLPEDMSPAKAKKVKA